MKISMFLMAGLVSAVLLVPTAAAAGVRLLS